MAKHADSQHATDPSKTAASRTKMGRSEQKSFGTPYFSIGVLPVEKINGSLFKAVWAEFVCTMLFIYLTTGTIVFGCHSSDVSTSSTGNAANGASSTPVDCFLIQSRVLTIATSFGVVIFVLVYASAPFSGGHLNPAVTIAFTITKKLSLIRAPLYITAQLGGAICGSFLVKYTDLSGFKAGGGGANRLLAGLPPSAAWLLECILTFALVFVILVATDQKRGQSTPHIPILAPMAIGFVVWACHLAALPLDGTSINPARSFAPALTSADFKNQWVFWAGPISGAVIAALVYELTCRISHDPILTVDRQDDAAQGGDTLKLPGYTGQAGLPSNDDAQAILSDKRQGIASGTEAQGVSGSGHIANSGGRQRSGPNMV